MVNIWYVNRGMEPGYQIHPSQILGAKKHEKTPVDPAV